MGDVADDCRDQEDRDEAEREESERRKEVIPMLEELDFIHNTPLIVRKVYGAKYKQPDGTFAVGKVEVVFDFRNTATTRKIVYSIFEWRTVDSGNYLKPEDAEVVLQKGSKELKPVLAKIKQWKYMLVAE